MANQSAFKKFQSESSHLIPHLAKALLFMLLLQVQNGFSQTYLTMKNSFGRNLKFRLVFIAFIFLSISNLQAQPTDARPIIKYTVNNYSTIAKAACDTCPAAIGKPLQKNRPIPFPAVGLINAIPKAGVNINEIPGICAPNFWGGGSPEIKGLVKSVAGMTDYYAANYRKTEILYFKSGAQGVAVSKSGTIYTGSLTVRLGPLTDSSTVNGFFSFKSKPERLPLFNSTSDSKFEQSPAKLVDDDGEFPNPDKEIAYFAIDPENEKIVYASLRNPNQIDEKLLARKNPDNGIWELLNWDMPEGNGLGQGVWGALAVDHDGNLYVADSTHHVIVKVTFDGNGKPKKWQIIGGQFDTPGFVNDVDEDARFNKPSGICVTEDGDVYVGDFGNNVIRKIDDDGEVTTYAGNEDGKPGFKDDHLWSNAKFDGPTALAYNEETETLYVVDYNNKTIREIDDDEEVSTLAGIAGSANPITDPGGFAMNFYYYLALLNQDPDEAKFQNPTGIAIDPSGLGLYVSDGKYIKYVNTFEAVFAVTAAIGDPKANVGPLAILPYGIAMNPNNGAFFGVPLVEWAPTTYAVAATNHLGISVLNGFITFQVVGCPSVPDSVAENKTISLSQLPFTWNGQVLNSAGTASVTLKNMYGCDSVVVLNLKVKPEFNYNSDPYILSLGQQIKPITPTTAGSAIDAFSISPALPAGLTLNAQTGIISGTPLAYATTQLFPAIGPQTAVPYPAPWDA